MRLLAASLEKGPRTLEAALVAAGRFRDDLVSGSDVLEYVRDALMSEAFDLTPVRILEIIIWMAKEERGYYRSL